MAGMIKRAKRSVRRKVGDWLHGAIHNAPDSLRGRISPALCYFEMLIVDYGIVRILYNNRHRISQDAWRSAQPAPHQIRDAARKGIKTVINLRGDQSFGTTWLEQRACQQNGVSLVNFKLRSRAAPSREELHAIRDLFASIEYPVLIHCKSGADRAGLMSVLYRHVREGLPIEKAKHELSFKYGHIRQADTGVLDYFFERYLADNARQPIDFWDWVDTRYDAEEVNRSFKAKPLANRLVNTILARE
ncbi:MAG: sulfur transferase domain-containing protein [Hyphomicrobiaceae bacterium]